MVNIINMVLVTTDYANDQILSKKISKSKAIELVKNMMENVMKNLFHLSVSLSTYQKKHFGIMFTVIQIEIYLQ